MEENIELYKRSVNIHKITDGEYIDKYVEIYLYVKSIFSDLDIVNNTYYKNNECIFKIDNDICFIPYKEVYGPVLTKFKLSDFYFHRDIFFTILDELYDFENKGVDKLIRTFK